MRATQTGLAAAAIVILVATGCGQRRPATTSSELAVEVTSPRPVPVSTRETRVEPLPPRPAEVGEIHVVRRGETLWSVARTYGLSVDELIAANGIADPEALAVGTRLRVPGLAAIAARWTWPVPQGELLSPFGAPRKTHRHQGIDIRGRRGQQVLASRSGRVVYSGASMRGYGKTVIIDHGDGMRSLYAHNSSLLVQVGQSVREGQAIARVGKSGNASTDHCHFEIRRDEVPVDPLRYVSTVGIGAMQ